LIQVIRTEPALEAIFDISDYLQNANPAAAVNVTRAIRIAADGLADFPARGRRVRGTGMREIGTKYQYLVRYRVAGDTVFILRVRRTARRPTSP
jgi:plasmid stabilization system protein ParE